MDDNETVAAILAAGTRPPPRMPSGDSTGSGPRSDARDGERTVAPTRQAPSGSTETLKRVAPFVAATLLTIASVAAADCTDADPWLALAGIAGDFEVHLDPQNPAQDLLLITNVSAEGSQLAAARINGSTGKVRPSPPSIIANNFNGAGMINGAEFVQKPTGELGVVYPGPSGVHAVFRSATLGAWNAFAFDVFGQPAGAAPPPLPSTTAGANPGAPIPLGQRTYAQRLGDCSGKFCYGRLDEDTSVDPLAVLSTKGLRAVETTQSPTDGYLYITACDASGACGIYEGLIDSAGGFVEGRIKKIADTGREAPKQMVAARHPATGSTILFSNKGSSAIDVWDQPGEGSALRSIGQVQVANTGTHYRAESSEREVVLHYLVRSGPREGSYTLPVALAGSALDAGTSKKISDRASGVELAWLPAASKWAILYRESVDVWKRCWVTP